MAEGIDLEESGILAISLFQTFTIQFTRNKAICRLF